ncbi:type VII secretion protein EssB [Bacillus massiliglaciei]|uniref:type VII secretion protein EssB n=1 Tax=Bacillus massiliglaciei TaxID=1816693 RepID=UPI000DA6244D|nr:type VII secretion protein EssB [Bacillus massiliglaciei]
MEKNPSYLENQTGAEIRSDDGCVMVFQRANLAMQHPLELELIKEIDPGIHKEIEVTENEVRITYTPPSSLSAYKKMGQKAELTKWYAAHQLVKKVKEHRFSRLNLLVCPENILFDSSAFPYFFHYGIRESLPPYEDDQERVLKETKASVAGLVDGQFDFEQYLLYYETLKLSPKAKEIMEAKSFDSLSALIAAEINSLEEKEKAFIHIPEKKWRVQRYLFWGTAAVLVPVLVYAVYSLLFSHPRQEAYVQSNENFLKQKYSEVIEGLEPYKPEKMPYVVQYELAKSYVPYIALADEQRKNVDKSLTLQTDSQFFQYWIHIGRGESEEALSVARSLEARDMIMYALYQRQEEIKADSKLSDDEKKEEMNSIETELEEYKQEIEEYERQLEEDGEAEEPASDAASGTGQPDGELQQEEGKPAEGEANDGANEENKDKEAAKEEPKEK